MQQYQTYARTLLQLVSSNDTIATNGDSNATSTSPSLSPLAGIQIAYPNEWLVNDLGNILAGSPSRAD